VKNRSALCASVKKNFNFHGANLTEGTLREREAGKRFSSSSLKVARATIYVAGAAEFFLLKPRQPE